MNDLPSSSKDKAHQPLELEYEKKPLTTIERKQQIQILEERFKRSSSSYHQLTYLRKKYSWLFVVYATKFVKRFLDLFLSLLLLLLLSPLLVFVALMIKLNDGGPVFYITNRVGKWGKEFAFPKFRTMCVNADKMKEELQTRSMHEHCGTFKMKKDPRITKIGRILRKTSIDELPQLYCVIKGEMTLVGPRPPLPSEVEKYTIAQRRRLDVVPGLTCLWQVKGRSDIAFEEQVKLDLEYIESNNIWLDLVILLKTIPAVFFGKGAY